ncbi:hypothetical protein MLD38_014004 [Melastoma candidum]|uniref:Uncharacterized protein n=1 Tax=Melastoma candidum TaxID=119954 RepID=A0ACB9RCQ4_9MYRT|nr:hypothetical protein MLD38_014004 [Melastoma candidum]
MHVLGLTLDLYSLLQFLFTSLLFVFGFLHLLKSAASKYLLLDTPSSSSSPAASDFQAPPRSPSPVRPTMPEDPSCFVCGKDGPKQCSRCKSVRYCSSECQSTHWKSDHKLKCKVFKPSSRATSGGEIDGNVKPIKQIEKVLFPYEEFLELYRWDNPGFPPCGLINCGNSCFANVVLQCLASTRPLVTYLLKKGHKKTCRRNEWCFMCELQTHLERASNSSQPFSPLNILSHLPKIGGNLGNGRQEDAHEFMRFAIDTMQSVCLDEFGGEKAVHPCAQETTLIQHIYGGHLQSQVICANCGKVSNQYENMMDLTVEIHGDAASLEECLDQFTVKEWLDGDNMYSCDGCRGYVKAWKCLTVRRAPNILTIALKRFQGGRFGKINKKVTFPETLDLSPYMSEKGDGNDLYRLYAVVVHLDMLNASFFGHYICYIKDFSGDWFRIDDGKVSYVGLEEVLSQGAYMLLYGRVSARPSCLWSPGDSTEVCSQKAEVDIPVSSHQTDERLPHATTGSGFTAAACEEAGIANECKTHEPMHTAEDNDAPKSRAAEPRCLYLGC